MAGPDHWRDVRAVRLLALVDAPDAFGTTSVEESALPDDTWRQRLSGGARQTLLAWHHAVARDDGGGGLTPAGIVQVGPIVGDPQAAGDHGVYGLFVVPSARGLGVAEALLAAAAGIAREAGAPRLRLDVGDHNTPAQRLYHRVGFRSTGRVGSLPAPRQHVTEHELALRL
ncbi:MAG: GNAT family N-acetyltransferase [Nitriliruptoraceae bacterium]